MSEVATRYRMRIYLGEADRAEGGPLFEWIVLRARASGLAGATVLRGIEGFGAHSRIHRASILRLSEDLPLVVELIDERARLERFAAELAPHFVGGLVTIEPIEVILERGPVTEPAP